MFKQAYCRGVQLVLTQNGNASYSDSDQAIKVADYVADKVDFDPSNVTPAQTHRIASLLVEASAEIQRNQPRFKAASFEPVKTWDEVIKLGSANAVQLMEMAEKSAEGSTIEGGDKGNMPAQSPVGETKMDVAARPPGYAENSQGRTEIDTRPGAVGSEKDQPAAPAQSPSGSNSVTEQRTAASLADMIRKIAEGSTILGGDKGNMMGSSAEAKMDEAQRPPGYGVLPSQGSLGALMNEVRGPAIIGRETPHPNAPSETPGGGNSLTQHSAKAAAEDDAWLVVFKKTAALVVPHMPASLPQETKIAHVRACMGMQPLEQAHYLLGLQTGERRASDGELPAFIREKQEERKEKEDKENPFAKKDDKMDGNPFAKKEDKKDDKKDDAEKEEKEAAMRGHLSRIEAAMRASRS